MLGFCDLPLMSWLGFVMCSGVLVICVIVGVIFSLLVWFRFIFTCLMLDLVYVCVVDLVFTTLMSGMGCLVLI